jgi:SAM-dependent methyltransferase
MENKLKTYTIVEIGPSSNPVFRLFRNETFENIGSGSTYIAVDSNPKELQKFRDSYGQKGNTLEGDLRDIPLPEESADQVWLMNVFGGFQNIPMKLSDGTLQYTLGPSGLFEELARIVRRNGVIYVGEIYPPMGDVSWLADEDFSGYGLEKRAHKSYDEVRPFMEKMGARTALVDSLKKDNKYLLFFLELTKM